MTPMGRSSDSGNPPSVRGVSIFVLIALGSVALATLVLHLWGIGSSLPHEANVDEPIFLDVALRMLRITA